MNGHAPAQSDKGAENRPFAAGGWRVFFLYRDQGIAEATLGRVIARRFKANTAPEKGTG